MSWFKKQKPTTLTDCSSGVLTCDGKHHAFSAWRDIRLQGKAWHKGMSDPMTYMTDAQERTCVVCNYRERRELDAD